MCSRWLRRNRNQKGGRSTTPKKMKLDNYVCENQLSIFDIMSEPVVSTSGPPILLSIGQEVFEVIRGDIRKFYVHDEKPWICGDGDIGYRLKDKDGGYGCAWNSSIGNRIFTQIEQAIEKAEEYLNNNECIRKESIVPISTVAYSYIRDCDERKMIAFYSILDNGMIYVKEFMTYQHLCKDVDNAIKKFMEQQEFEYCNPKKIDYIPEYKNMYPCKNDSDWCYAEAKYGQLI